MYVMRASERAGAGWVGLMHGVMTEERARPASKNGARIKINTCTYPRDDEAGDRAAGGQQALERQGLQQLLAQPGQAEQDQAPAAAVAAALALAWRRVGHRADGRR